MSQTMNNNDRFVLGEEVTPNMSSKKANCSTANNSTSSNNNQGHSGQQQDTSRMSSAKKESTSSSHLKATSTIKKDALDSDSGKNTRKDPFQNMWSSDIFRDYPSKPPLLQPPRSKATKTNSTVSNYNRTIYRSCTFG
jgi:hypothetical protein